MKRVRLGLGALSACAVVLSGTAWAQGGTPAPSSSAPAEASSAPPVAAPVELGPQFIGPASTPAKASGAPKAGGAEPGKTEPAATTEPGKADTQGATMRAYQTALAAQKLGGSTALTTDAVAEALSSAEVKLDTGRRDEAIGDLVYLVESPRFAPFRELDGGRNAVFLLGDALGRAGAEGPARGYLVPLLDKNPIDVWGRRAARSLVDMGLDSDHPEVILHDLDALKKVGAVPDELSSDVAYLAGRTAHRAGKSDAALAEFAKVSPRSRFWAQATYLSGLVETGRGRLKEGENQFCKVADVKQTPREALAFGGGDFFEVRDLSRLGLGRVAHEQYRFDDARYYYYLVPNDSQHVSEALYEAANSRYEAKDYKGARDLLDEMRSRGEKSRYEDEYWIFDAYVDLALCQFPSADEKLKTFLKRYDPIRDAARRTAKDPRALSDLVESVRTGTDPEALETRNEKGALRALGVVLRGDPDFGVATRRLGELDHEMSGLRQSMAALDDAKTRLTSSTEVRPRAAGALNGNASERAERLDAQLAELRRLIREVKATNQHAADVEQLEQQLASLEARARDAAQAERPAVTESHGGTSLPDLVASDWERASTLYGAAQTTRTELSNAQLEAAKDALGRLDQRLSRLLRRARLGRIETVLGKKRAVEVEIEALSEGFLPQGAVDSLEAARYLRDDEEYWPYDGEDWADEYVGGEGLR